MNEQIAKLQSVTSKLLSNRESIRVLEAGCGSSSHNNMGQNVYIVGIDISEKQLERNSSLNEKIRGDIQSYNLPVSHFDVIVCWNVLEHLSQPEKALRTFVKAVKTNGIIILALPNVMSVKGLITKYTPHWFHIWVYKTVLGRKNAGTDDYGPFRTFLNFSISPRSMKRFACDNSLSIQYVSLYEGAMQRRIRSKYRLVNLVFGLVERSFKLLTFGRIDVNLTDYIIVLKKEARNDS